MSKNLKIHMGIVCFVFITMFCFYAQAVLLDKDSFDVAAVVKLGNQASSGVFVGGMPIKSVTQKVGNKGCYRQTDCAAGERCIAKQCVKDPCYDAVSCPQSQFCHPAMSCEECCGTAPGGNGSNSGGSNASDGFFVGG